MKNLKWIIAAVLAVVVGAGGIFGYQQFQEKQRQNQMNSVAKQWVEALEKGQYEDLAKLVTTSSLKESGYTPEMLVEKYEAVYKGIGVHNVDIAYQVSEEGLFTYKANLETVLGELKAIEFESTLQEDEDTFKVDWTAALIFPQMQADDKVRYKLSKPQRGEIIDRNGVKLAELGEIKQAGVVPKNLQQGERRTAQLKEIAEALSITEEFIEGQLSQSWVKEDHFVPLKSIASGGEMPEIDGVLYQPIKVRHYPLAEAAAHIVGYVGEVSAEDLEKNPSLRTGDYIGRTGIERAYDERLRGKIGGEINIERATGEILPLQSVEAVEGETIQLTIDSKVQTAAYDALQEAAGSTVVTAPTTGDILASVSKPSYNPNLFVIGISQTDYNAYNDDEQKPFLSRYAVPYAPGSTFKPITAAIAMEAGTLKPEESLAIAGLQWQPDASWGKYKVTRVTEKASVNLRDALVQSDNIYFAQQALKMGEEKFRAGMAPLIFGKKLDLPMNMDAAQISSKDAFESDILLADTAYGQGQLQMTPIQMATVYSVLANNGKQVEPKLLFDQEVTTTDVFKAETITALQPALKEVITASEGTAHVLNGVADLAAKTGTAELKATQGERGTENSLLVVYDAAAQNYLVVTVVEDHTTVGSTATQLVKPLLQQLAK